MGNWPSHRLGTRVIYRCPHCKCGMVAIKPHQEVVSRRTGETRTVWTCVKCYGVVEQK
jgi:uncharacterized protein with PIN domain